MRLDQNTQGVKAADLLNVLREDQLEEMFAAVMEPGSARWLTKRVVEKRNQEFSLSWWLSSRLLCASVTYQHLYMQLRNPH